MNYKITFDIDCIKIAINDTVEEIKVSYNDAKFIKNKLQHPEYIPEKGAEPKNVKILYDINVAVIIKNEDKFVWLYFDQTSAKRFGEDIETAIHTDNFVMRYFDYEERKL